MGQWGTQQPVPEPKAMPLADKVFYVVSGAFFVVFGTGLWLIFGGHDLSVGIPLTGLGVIGMGVSLLEKPRDTTPETRRQRTYMLLNAILAICIVVVVGYDIYDRRSHGRILELPSGTAISSDSRDPSRKEADVIRDLAIKGSYKVAVYCLTTEGESCHFAKEWLRVLKTAGWKTNGLNETDYGQPINGLVVCTRPDSNDVASREFELALRENSIPVSDECRVPELAKDNPTFDFAFLVGGP